MAEKNIVSSLLSSKNSDQENKELMLSDFPIVVFLVTRDELHMVADVLRSLPPLLGMAYVVVESMTKELNGGPAVDGPRSVQLLQGATTMCVQAVEEDPGMEKDHVYWAGQGNGELDIFLSSLASIFSERIVVVMSFPMARAVAVGLRVVQMEGGLTLIMGDQREGLKEPGSYLRDCIDFVVEADAVADKLAGLAERLVAGGLNSLKAGIDGDFLSRIFFILSDRKGIDLSILKEDDVARRIFRRMVLKDTSSREEYFEALAGVTGEADLLYEELLCCSTGFTPEPGLVMQLADRVLPGVMESMTDARSLRIWMPACVCGEEAYAVLFCVIEYLQESGHAVPVQLFASGLNKAAIAKARTGVFSEASVRTVAPGWRRKFFTEKNGLYHINKGLKEMCVFAMHNLLKDPPFSHIDVVIGRNMMVGMDRAGQKKVLESLHYALNEGGWFLPGSHRVGGISDYLFNQVSEEPRVYRRLEGPTGFAHASLVPEDRGGEDEANEEMMASHVELRSINQELQSINQALEKSRDDLQSCNTELDSVNKDLNQRNRELELSIEHAYAVIAAVRQPLMVLRDDLRIRMVNPYFCQTFRVSPDELEGEYLYTAARGYWDIDELRKKLQGMIAHKLVTMEIELKHVFPRTGEKIFVFTATRIQEEGKFSDILLAMEDVTERRMVDRFKDEFIGIACHELKTPTTSIMAYSQLLLDELKGASDQRAAMLVERLNNQVGRLARLTKDLLDVTRISQGQISLKKHYFNLNDLIEEMADEMQVTTPIHIIIGELASVPSIWGDEERIGQVLRNLLSNAIKYSPAAKEVRIYTKATKKNVHISVEDLGIGMSTETLQRVFDRFYRSDDPSVNRHPGLGLGLYIASEIIRIHGGTITVKSEKGKGSVFTVILPFGSQD